MQRNEVVIEKLEFPYNVQKKSGMYGADGTNADILFREIVDNTVDLALKFRQSVKVKALINKDGWNYVEDNGLGLPLYLDKDFPDFDQPILIDMMRKINVGSNITKVEYSSGTNGVGSKLAIALSEYFFFIVNASKKDKSTLPKFLQEELDKGNSYYLFRADDGHFQYQKVLDKDSLIKYFSGFPEDIEKAIQNLDEDFGTVAIFKPSLKYLDTDKVTYHGYPFKLMKSLFKYDKDLANINVEFSLNGKPIEPYSFKSEFNDKLLEDKIFHQSVIIPTEEKHPIRFIYEIGYSLDKFNFDFDGSANLLKTPNGKHISLVQSAVGTAFHKFNNLISPNDAKLGQRLFVLNFAVGHLFNSQDKTKLSKFEDRGYDEKKVLKALSDSFYKLMEENADYFNLLCQRILEYKKATDKLSNIELLKSKIVLGDEGDRKRAMSGEMAKVYDCTGKDYKQNELYIVEGLSACFTGDTEILDVNFNKLTMLDLIERKAKNIPTYTFSCSPEGLITVSKVIEVSETKIVNNIVKIYLDNGKVIKCTPDHKIMLRDGTYCEAIKLTENDSLMPIYYNKPDDGYGMVRHNTRLGVKYNPKKHRLDKESGFYYEKVYKISQNHIDCEVHSTVNDNDDIHCHHKDFKKDNDYPTNLLICSRKHHRILHCKESSSRGLLAMREKYPDLPSIGGKALQEKLKSDPQFRQEVTKKYSEGHKRTLAKRKNEIVKLRKETGIRTGSFFEIGTKQAEYMKTANHKDRRLKQNLTSSRYLVEVLDMLGLEVNEKNYLDIRSELCPTLSLTWENYLHYSEVLKDWKPKRPKPNPYLAKYNHKVLKVEIVKLDKPEPVYDIEVDSEYHNFPLASGVFVHNCAGLLKGRNKVNQAVLPLRGKLANTSNFDEERLVDNKEVLAIVNTIGCGLGGICDPSKSRYGKIIIATDLDSDGSHIANLITTLFYQHAPEMIKQGLIYKLEAPYYKVESGKKIEYFYYDEKDKVDFSKTVTKLKGLGSYNLDEVKQFMTDPKNRRLIQLKWDSELEAQIEEASKLMYSSLARRNLMLETGVFVEGSIL